MSVCTGEYLCVCVCVYRYVCVYVCISSEDFIASLIKSSSLSLLRLGHSLLHSCVSLAGSQANETHIHALTHIRIWTAHTSSTVDSQHNGHISSQGSSPALLLHPPLRIPRLNYAITALGLDAEYQ